MKSWVSTVLPETLCMFSVYLLQNSQEAKCKNGMLAVFVAGLMLF